MSWKVKNKKMGNPLLKQSIVLGLSGLLLMAAVPGEAFCICNDSTPQCCGEDATTSNGSGCCKPLLGEAASSLPQLGCSLESIPSNTVNDSHPCRHLGGLTGTTAATVPVISSEDLSDSSKIACEAVHPLSGYDFTTISVSLKAVSPMNIAPLAPTYLLFASLII
jgi:hypothetical protein